MNLIQVVPGLFPKIDGIGDYALQLARKLRENHNILSTFVVGDPHWTGGEVEGFHATRLHSRSPQGFTDAIAECEQLLGDRSVPILFQFSPYGYEKRGYPRWLLSTLESWDARHPGTLNFCFHELEVNSSRPWGSAFWVSPLQRLLIARLARLRGFKYTNTEIARHKLERWGSGRMELIPNYSNIGEPSVYPPFANRRRDIVVFARAAQRKANYDRGSDVLRALCDTIGAERIVDIGEPIPDHQAPDLQGIPFLRLGRLPSNEVSHWLASSVASFITYPVPLLTKSGVHAASCAHGAIPFVFDNEPLELSCPPLVNGVDYVPLSRGTNPPLPPLEQLSQAVFDNYQTRTSRAAADTVARKIFGVSVPKSLQPEFSNV